MERHAFHFSISQEAYMTVIYYRETNKPLAQKLRREMTRHERHLWYDCLKQLPNCL